MKLEDITPKPRDVTDKRGIPAWLVHKLLLRRDEFTINTDFTITVREDVVVPRNVDEFPFKFRDIHGSFSCDGNKRRTTLHNCPDTVLGFFDCCFAAITSLKGGPSEVHGVYSAAHCHQLESLEGGPTLVKGDVDFPHSNIRSLKNVHKFLPNIEGMLHLDNVPIKSHMMGLMLIRNLMGIRFDHNLEVQRIFNTHLTHSRNAHACQQELIESGFAEYARL